MGRSRMVFKAMATIASSALLVTSVVPVCGASAAADSGSVLEQVPPTPNISTFSTANWDAGWYRMQTNLQIGDCVYSFDDNTIGTEIQTEDPADYCLASLPEYLRGSDCIVPRRTQRREVFFKSERAIAVYAAIDTTYGEAFSWETGWTKTDDTVSTADGTLYALYRKTYAAKTQVRIKKLGADTDTARNYFLMILPTEGETIANALTHEPVLPQGERDDTRDRNTRYQYYVNDVYNRAETDALPEGYTVSGAADDDRIALSERETPSFDQGDLTQNTPYLAGDIVSSGSPVDNNVNTYWESKTLPGNLTIDLGAAKAINRLVLKVKSGWGERTQTIEVKGSTDSQSFETLVPARDYRFHPDQDNTVTVTLSTVVTRYVQLCFTANTGSNGGQLSEVEIYGPDRSRYELAAGVNLARGCPFQVTSDRYNGGSPVDGDPTTYWRSDSVQSGATESVTVDLQHALTVNRVALRLWPRWGDRTQMLEVQGSVDGTTYTTLVPSAEYAFVAQNNAVTISFVDTTVRYIRVAGTANTGDTGIQIGELEVYGPAQTVSYSGNRTLDMKKASVGADLTLTRALDTAATGQLVVDTRVRFSAADAGMELLSLRDAAGRALATLRQGADGVVQLVTTAATRDTAVCTAEEWHTLKLVLDQQTGTVAVWVDHLLTADQIPIATDALAAVTYTIPAAATGTLQVDYCRVYDNTEQYVASEMFDDQPTGSVPAGWSVSGSAAIAEMPFPTDKSLQLAGKSRVTRAFDPISGDVTVEAKVRPASSDWVTAPLVTDADGRVAAKVAFYRNSLFVSNGQNWAYLCDQEVPHNYYAADNWYLIKLVMNTDTRRYDVYVDGARRYSGAAFAEPVEAVSQLSFATEQANTLYIDQVKVYDSASLARDLMPQQPVFDVRDYGAVGDGKTDDTAAINKAVNAAAGTGGTVLLENGTFCTGQITLASDLTFFIAPSATLYANIDRHAYNKVTPSNGYNGNRQLGRGILYFQNAKNVRITGGGTIFGNGFYGYGENDPSDQRPCILYFAQSQDVTVEDLNMVQSPFWTVVPYESQQVTVRRVNITNHTAPNRDGVDPVNSSYITIEDCNIFAGDDAICPKSGNRIPMTNIEVRRCLLQSDCNGIKIGTDTQGPIHDLSFEDICIKKVGLSGITIQSIDGSDIERIRFERVDMNDVDNALFVCIGNRYRMPIPNPGYTKKLGSIRDLTFENIRFTNPMDHPYSQKSGDNIHEMMLIGLNPKYNTIEDGEEHHISDVLFKNVYLEMPGGATTVPVFTEGISNGYPEHDALKTSTGWAYTLRWTDNVRFVNCQSVAAKADARDEIVRADYTDNAAQTALWTVVEQAQAVQSAPNFVTAPETLRQSLTQTLDAAIAVYEDNNATTADSEQAREALQTALAAYTAVVKADKTALQQAIAAAPTDLSGYTVSSAAAFRAALEAAVAVAADTNATQLQVNTALAALQTAQAALEIDRGTDPADEELRFSATDGIYTRLMYGTMFYTDWKTGDTAPTNMSGSAANGANKNMVLQATVTLTPLHEGVDVSTAWKKMGFRLRSAWVNNTEQAAQFYMITPQDVTMNADGSFQVAIPLSQITPAQINWQDVRDLNVTCELNDPYRYAAQQDSPDMTLTLSNVRIAAIGSAAVDTARLQAAVERANAVDRAAYTDRTMAALETALTDARAILLDTAASQVQVDAACALLETALLQLKQVVWGNVDEDDQDAITVVDALMTLQAAAGRVELSASARRAADVDGAAGVTAGDALLILRRAAGAAEEFPVETDHP